MLGESGRAPFRRLSAAPYSAAAWDGSLDGRPVRVSVTIAPLEGNASWMTWTFELSAEGADYLREVSLRLGQAIDAFRDTVEADFRAATAPDVSDRPGPARGGSSPVESHCLPEL